MTRGILAIDPGTRDSAYVSYVGGRGRSILRYGKESNAGVLDMLRSCAGTIEPAESHQLLAIEMIQSFGMPVGAETFQTVVWIGRFLEAWAGDYVLVYRTTIKGAICGNVRAKDPNIRAALIDRFGGSKEIAIGTKNAQGPLYGLTKDVWSALAVAVTVDERGASAGFQLNGA